MATVSMPFRSRPPQAGGSGKWIVLACIAVCLIVAVVLISITYTTKKCSWGVDLGVVDESECGTNTPCVMTECDNEDPEKWVDPNYDNLAVSSAKVLDIDGKKFAWGCGWCGDDPAGVDRKACKNPDGSVGSLRLRVHDDAGWKWCTFDFSSNKWKSDYGCDVANDKLKDIPASARRSNGSRRLRKPRSKKSTSNARRSQSKARRASPAKAKKKASRNKFKSNKSKR